MSFLFATASQAAENGPSIIGPDGIVATITSDVDRLLALQDSAASGNPRAAVDQKDLLPRIREALETAPETRYPELVEQTVAFVLSGGDPASADRLSRSAGISKDEQELLNASSAFMSGDRTRAATLFKKIEPIGLSARLAGRVALAKALLSKEQERQSYYAVAMASMPGTLVEESAIRRSALAYAEGHDETNMWKMVDRYARRFPHSIFADDFWRDFVISFTAWTLKGPGPSATRLDHVASMLPRNQRRSVYLALARASAAQGLPDATGFAGRRLYRLALEGSTEAQLGQFYSSLFGIVTPEGDAALKQLRSVRKESLGPQELPLLEAAMSLGLQIERPPAGPKTAAEMADEKMPLEDRGAELLSKSYDLIADGK